MKAAQLVALSRQVGRLDQCSMCSFEAVATLARDRSNDLKTYVAPLSRNITENRSAIDDSGDIRCWHRSPEFASERSRVRLVEENIAQINIWSSDHISSGVCYICQDVCVGIPTTEVAQLPIGFDCCED